MKQYSVDELCEHIIDEYSISGNTDGIYINRVAAPNDADESSLIFISHTRLNKVEMLRSTRARVVICDKSLEGEVNDLNKCLIITDDPKYLFARLVNKIFLNKTVYSIHPSAIIDSESIIAANVQIGPNVYIGKSTIGEGTIIHGNTYIYDNVHIGRHVIIHAGAIIGADGCGQIKGRDGVHVPFPHIGKVVIGDDVVIGTNCGIAKGALGDTVIGNRSVIDSFVQVGHNVVIDDDVIILANAVVGGSARIGKNALVAIGVHICDYINIGHDAHLGPGTVIMSDIPPNTKVVSRPPVTLPTKESYKN